jgi:hypothetical protein
LEESVLTVQLDKDEFHVDTATMMNTVINDRSPLKGLILHTHSGPSISKCAGAGINSYPSRHSLLLLFRCLAFLGFLL